MKIPDKYLKDSCVGMNLYQHINPLSLWKYSLITKSVSCLAHTLFIAYVNDLCSLYLENGNITTYAYDTVLFFKGQTWEDVYSSAKKGVNLISKCLDNNFLSLNLSKTN